jgi:hypothetical protein
MPAIPPRLAPILASALVALCLACTAPPQPAPVAAPSATASSPAAVASRSPAAVATAALPPAPQPPPPPAALAPAGQVLFQQSGGGGTASNCCTVGLSTNQFSSPGSWDLNWNYDCNGLGRAGNLSVDVFGAGGAFVSDPPSVFQIGSGGSGVQAYGHAGTFSLSVNSTCRWSLTVTTAARPTATPVGSMAGAASAAVSAAIFAGSSIATATVAAGAGQTRGALQALQPSIPTPRPVIPPALGAFASFRPGSSGSGAAPSGAVGAGSTSAVVSSAVTSTPSATPLRAITPTH